MDEKLKPWVIGAVLLACIVGYFFWKQSNPTLLDGGYWCEGRTNHPDGTSSAIDADASVEGGKVQIGQTGADIAVGHQVMSWGTVKKTSPTEFLVELTPSAEIRSEVPDPFWLTCQRV